MRTAAILTAAGSGSRLGHELPKALVPVRGEPIVVHAARALAQARPGGVAMSAVVVTAPAAHLAEFERVLPGVQVVAGGATRQASVARALDVLADDVDVVLVHDAARPFVPADMVERVARAVLDGHPAVIPGLPVTDTIKQVGDGVGGWPVERTVDRSVLRAVQTPQGFARDVLVRAHAAAAADADDEQLAASDDAGLVERLGLPVWVVPGDERAAKITTRRDLLLAELDLEENR
ncbi:2-C-methyl-D-erythritol 4-phosphate cytidylyltransferase [Cellulomonas sp. HZM]|uniref:2-C-methyl-D-erythritol 4-phosphate cytidylyltransferase n=1 Tax=Cellulomonas sp. HZM TaxID=1454010 RepID=UPI0004936E3E|nr:2-C-methyl-D-erythritol 4-phosphate cytidylyltransferase [Cellulomonas sp. HZM]